MALPQNIASSPLLGVVLCGGKSSRMKQDKAWLSYQHQPQWLVVHQLLQPLCDKVVISVNPKQSQLWNLRSQINLVVDLTEYQGHGPMTGLLSVIEAYPDWAIFLVACDYPYLQTEHLLKLLNRRSPNFDAVCYQSNNQIEPLVTIFENSAIKKLKYFYKSGSDSINRFIQSVDAKIVDCDDKRALTNVNKAEEFHRHQANNHDPGNTDHEVT